MPLKVVIPTQQITFTPKQLEDWKAGKRDDCPEGYCKRLPGSYGFGEYLVGQHFASQGYLWIHHDFSVFGGNRPGKYPEAEHVISQCISGDKYEKMRFLNPLLTGVEEPDLLIYKPDFSEIRFAESKRLDTRDKIRESQVRGLALLALLLNCEVDLFEVVRNDVNHITEPLEWILSDVYV